MCIIILLNAVKENVGTILGSLSIIQTSEQKGKFDNYDYRNLKKLSEKQNAVKKVKRKTGEVSSAYSTMAYFLIMLISPINY
jgi:hypothetical protein